MEGDNAGISVPQMVAFRRIAGGGLPSGLQLMLQTWEARLGQASLRQVVLLEFASPEVAREALEDRQIAPLIARVLTPTLVTVQQSDTERLSPPYEGGASGHGSPPMGICRSYAAPSSSDGAGHQPPWSSSISPLTQAHL